MSDIPPPMPPRENIILIGFMGSGKSTVGRMLAKRLRFHFLDTDRLIEERARMSIKSMFESHGEIHFRERETATLESLSGLRRHVLATGGGIVTQSRNVPLLHALGWVVQLTADPDELYARVAKSTGRPLLKTENPMERVHTLLAERRSMYESAAQFTVNSTGLSRERVVDLIIDEARGVFGW
jgi:shikimate kinase